VIGREFNPDVLVKIGALSEDEVLDALDEAAGLQLIREARIGKGSGYTFEHALIRQTLYEDLNIRRRARLHQQIGEALEAFYGRRLHEHVEEVAYHFGEAGVQTAEKGITYNLQAARKAADLYALEEAERRLSTALELAENNDDLKAQATVQEALADLYLLFSDQRAVPTYQRALDAVRARGDGRSEDEVRLYCRIAEASAGWWTQAPSEALPYARTAVERLAAQHDSPLKARALSLLAMHLVRAGEVAQARPHAAAAVEMAARLEDRNTLSIAYRAMAMVHRYANEWDRFSEVVQRRRSLLDTAFTPADADLYTDLLSRYENTGDLDAAERVGREFAELAERLRSPRALFRALNIHSLALYWNNKWDEALEVAERAIALEQRLQLPASGSRPHGTSGMIHAQRGNDDQAREHAAQLESLTYPPPEHAGPRQFALQIALLLEDRDLVARLVSKVESERPRCQACALTFNIWVGRARLLLGDLDGAQAKLDEARQQLSPGSLWEDRLDLLEFAAWVDVARGHPKDAVTEIEQAVQIARAGPVTVRRAVTLDGAARTYLARRIPGDLERARTLLAEAIQFYQIVQARRLEDRARQLLESIT
jgi:tetratricopeptide (TPR) repeat protein